MLRMGISKKLKRVISAGLILALTIVYLPMQSVFATSATYYVSATAGSDSNNGKTEQAPFKTISKAVSEMKDGDTCEVMGGVYRESVLINGKNNLTFKAYNDDRVVVSATKVIDEEFVSDSTNVWRIDDFNSKGYSISSTSTERDVVFFDDKLAVEARWPNLPAQTTDEHSLLNLSNYARVKTQGDVGSLTMSATHSQTFPSGVDLTSAYVWCASGVAYWSYMAKITKHSGSQLTLADVFSGYPSYYPDTGNLCYITGSKNLLDAEGEWFVSEDRSKFYIYSESDPRGKVEIRNNTHAIKVTSSSNIIFDGIDVRGSVMELGSGATGCTIKNGVFETMDVMYDKGKDTNGGSGASSCRTMGLTVGGSNNLVTGCEIKNMYGPGILIKGTGNRVINNYVHDVNMEHTYSDGIRINSGKNHLVSHNTLKRLGRGAIGGYFTESVISYNHMTDASRLSQDTGVLYIHNNNYHNTEIHHNVLGNSTGGEGMQFGLYFDTLASGLIVYNNLIYGQETEDNVDSCVSLINALSPGNLFYNNTYVNEFRGVRGLRGDRSGTAYVNNLFTKEWQMDYWNWDDMIAKNNAVVSRDVLNSDYTLKDTATGAIDKGLYLEGISNGYEGAAPDCGAFEKGKAAWTAGCDFNNADYAKETFKLNSGLPLRNVLKNPGFDGANFDNWTKTGESVLMNIDSWGYNGSLTRSGGKAALIKPNALISQTITGLKPNTAYEIGGYSRMTGPHIYSYGKDNTVWASEGTSDNLKNSEGKISARVGGFTTDKNYIHYSKFDFGTGFDRLYMGFNYPKANDTTVRTVTIHKGSPDGEVIGSVSTGAPDTFMHDSYEWEWKGAELTSAATGIVEDVYFCFETTGTPLASFGGFFLYDSNGGDKVTFAATTSRETKSVDVATSSFPRSRPYTTVTTGGDGSLTFTVSKSAGLLDGCVDELFVREAFVERTSAPEPVPEIEKTVNIRNAKGELATGMTAGELNIFEIMAKNTANTAQKMLCMLAVYDADNILIDIKSFKSDMAAESSQQFGIGTVIPTGAYAKMFVWDSVASLKPIFNMVEWK